LFDNHRVIVPIKKIWGDVIRNMNAEKTRRIDLLFDIGHEDNVDQEEKILHEMWIIANWYWMTSNPLSEPTVWANLRWISSCDHGRIAATIGRPVGISPKP
jgi:hypothetical protein